MTKIRLRFVNEYLDRHGKIRRYFRRPGSRSVKLPGLPGSIEFMAAYQAALAVVAPPPPSPRHVVAGSLADVAAGFFRWPLGTRERLAFALLLYTGQRGGDVCRMTRSDIIGGRIRVVQDKARKGTTTELMIPIHPALARALKAGPVVGMHHLITDSRGKPLSALTDVIEAAVRKAGLPDRCVAHGLRKAALRRLAECGATTKQIAAVSGHRSLSEIERYTAKADQAGLADSAIAKLPDREKS
jgi:integrase